MAKLSKALRIYLISLLLFFSFVGCGDNSNETNKPPTARAGENQSVQVGSSVTLDASKSTDTDGTITKYEWFEGATSLGVGQTLTKSDFSVGVHELTLKVTDNNGATASDNVVITIKEKEIIPTNNPPTAKAGENQSVQEGQSVTLDASSSIDTDGTITKYEWSENNQLLSNEKTFTKNDFTVGVHELTLKVTDNEGATNSDSVTITITALPNQSPIARAGDNQTVQVGSSVTLDGSKSTDTDGTITKYEWLDKNNNSLHVGKSYTTNSLTVGVHELTLKVTDNEGATNSDSVTITITALPPTNQFPTAKAGDDQSVQVGQSVTLDASSSTDTDGTITKYEWFEGTTSLGVGQTLTKNDFSVGVHELTLKVIDNEGATAEDKVTITITAIPNQSPTAKAGDDQSVQVGSSVTLDANASTDTDGTIVSYEWSENGTTLSTQKTFTKNDFTVGVHELTLKVIDNEGATAEDKVTITITAIPNQSPTAKAGDDQEKQEGESVTLDANASTDTDGTIVSYEWSENNQVLSTQKTFTKSDFSVGEHTITLKVTDDDGTTASDTVKVTITVARDTTFPIASIAPTDQATNVGLDSNITITFSEEMNGSTLTNTNIALTKAGNTIPLAYTSRNDNNTTLTLAYTSVFDFSTNYTLTIQNVTDKAGNTISPDPTTSTFTTLAKPSLNGKYLKTGQNTIYQAKDDGDYKKGVDRSYTRVELNATAGIVVDNVTGFMWQDEEYTQAEATAIDNKTEIGKAQHWVNAKTYCDTLTLGGFEDWRLPNINELETIVDYGRIRNNPTGSLGAINPIFKYVGQAGYSIYWSSTAYLFDTSYAWHVGFGNGYDNWDGKSRTNYVRCVR